MPTYYYKTETKYKTKTDTYVEKKPCVPSHPITDTHRLTLHSVTKTKHVPVTKTKVEDKKTYTTRYETKTKETRVPTKKYETKTEQKCETIKCHPKGCGYKGH